MTPTAIFLGATAMTTGAGADTDERPSERDAPGMKAEPMSEGTRSIVCVRRRKSESAPKDVRSSALSRGAIIKGRASPLGSCPLSLRSCPLSCRALHEEVDTMRGQTTPDSILVLLTRHSLVDHALLRLRFPSLCGRARRSGGPKLVRPTRQPPCAHPSTRRRLLSPLSGAFIRYI